MEYPIKPTLTTPTLGTLPTFNKIVPEPLTLPTFDGILPLEPADTVMTTLPFVYTAYANVVQDALDDRIVDLVSYCVPTLAFMGAWSLAKDKVLRKYHKARVDLLRSAGQKNLMGMPGHIMLQLKDLGLDERRELADEIMKIADQNINLTLDTVEAALRNGLESNAVRFDSHHKLQSANFEAASTIVDAGLKAAGLRVQAYNKNLEAVESQVQQVIRSNEARIKELEAFAQTLQIPALEAETQTLLMEVYQAQVKFEAEAAAMDLVVYDAYIIGLELEKTEAELEVARAELVLSQTNAVTAQYLTQYAQAHLATAELDKYKVKADLAKLDLERQGVNVERAKSQLASAIDLAQTQYEGQRNTVNMAKEDLQVAIMAAEEAITKAETDQATTIANTAIQNAIQKVADFKIEKDYDRASREVPMLNSVNSQGNDFAMVLSTAITDYSLIASDVHDAMRDAAKAAADSEVTTDFYRS